MKNRQLRKYLKKEAKKGVMVLDGKMYFSNDKILDSIKKEFTSTETYGVGNLYGMPFIKISERGHMAAIALGAIS